MELVIQLIQPFTSYNSYLQANQILQCLRCILFSGTANSQHVWMDLKVKWNEIKNILSPEAECDINVYIR